MGLVRPSKGAAKKRRNMWHTLDNFLECGQEMSINQHACSGVEG